MIGAASVVIVFLVNTHFVKFNVLCLSEDELAVYNATGVIPRAKNLSRTPESPEPAEAGEQAELTAKIRPLFSFDGHQNITVRGRLLCCKPPFEDHSNNCQPVRNAEVLLYDYDYRKLSHGCH